MEARALKCSKIRRIASRGGNIEMRLYAARRVRNFDVPYEDVTSVQLMACQLK
jgi:hypothetical protein